MKAWVQEAGQMLILNVKKQMPSGDRDWPAPDRDDPEDLGVLMGYVASDHGDPFPIYSNDYYTHIPLLSSYYSVYDAPTFSSLVNREHLHHTAVNYIVNEHSIISPFFIYHDALPIGLEEDRCSIIYSGTALTPDIVTINPNCSVQYIRDKHVIRISTTKQLQTDKVLVAEPGCFLRHNTEDLTDQLMRGMGHHFTRMEALTDAMIGITNVDHLSESDNESHTGPEPTVEDAAIWAAQQDIKYKATKGVRRGLQREVAQLTADLHRDLDRGSWIFANLEHRAQNHLGPTTAVFGKQQCFQLKHAQLSNLTQIKFTRLFNDGVHSSRLADKDVRISLRYPDIKVTNSGTAVLIGTAHQAERVLLYNELRELLSTRVISMGNPLWEQLHNTFHLNTNRDGHLNETGMQLLVTLRSTIRSKRLNSPVTVQFIPPEDIPPPNTSKRSRSKPRASSEPPVPTSTIATTSSAIAAPVSLLPNTLPAASVTVPRPQDFHWHARRINEGHTLAAFHTDYRDPATGHVVPVPSSGRVDGYYPRLIYQPRSVIYLPESDELTTVDYWQDGWSSLDDKGGPEGP